ncbi:MAG: hypothetical protein CVV44_23320 [Spirochaetae bacterium HGW-Spirochaetae-1]|jgi:hypothetical protein|nr:MAG: hypothetical protein CVV44_23320 [Spirochaetae bacterium HGW-Spirochaetae-1]
MSIKIKLIGLGLVVVLVASAFIYFRYFFTYEQRNMFQRKIETVTGQNLSITIFGFDGRIIQKWTGVQKITSSKPGNNYTYFYTRENKYVQIPNSVWYIAEEE